MIKLIVTKFKEFKALIINIKTNPKLTDPEIKIFFKTIFKLKVIAKNKEIKKNNNWIVFA